MKKTLVTESSGNIFADLGLEQPEQMLAKAELTIAISEIIKNRKLTQAKAAKLLGTSQSNISCLKTGRDIQRFTFDKLLSWLNTLDRNVKLTVSKKPTSVPLDGENQGIGLIKVAV